MKTEFVLAFLFVAAVARSSFAAETASVPAPWSERLARAEQALSAGRASEAASAFAALLDERAPDLDAAEGRVHALLATDDWREALAEASRRAEGRSGEDRLSALVGEALFRAGRFDQAERALAGLAERPDAPPRGLVTLARLRDAEGRSDLAGPLADRAVVLGPDDPDVLYWAADSAASRAKTIEWLDRFLKAGAGGSADRRDAARGTVGILRELGDRAVWVVESRPERVELPLARLWDPETGVTQGFVVRALLGEGERARSVPLLLDTGSPGLLVLERVARKRGFSSLGEQTSFGGGGEGRHATRRGLFPVLDLGGLRFRDVLATTSDVEIDPLGRYHGVLGLAAFGGYCVTLDLARARLVLEPPSDAPGSRYWTVGGQWVVTATMAEASVLFLLDTGATRTIVALAAAERLSTARLGPAVSIEGVGGALPGARVLSGVEIIFEGRPAPARDLRAADLSLRSRIGGVEISGFLGLDLLAGTRLQVDTVSRRVRVEQPSRKP